MSVADKLGTGSSFSQAPRGRSARGRAKAVAQGDVPAYELVRLRLEEVSPTPLNPRRNFGTDEDKSRFGEELRQAQLAACVAVTRDAYLALWPDHADRIGTAMHVLVNGERRYHSGVHVGLDALDFVIRDDLAVSREEFINHLLKENLEREDFDVIERARGVNELVQICAEQSERGSRTRAAQRLGKDRSWVTNQLALLELPEELQTMLSAGALPERDGRSLARHLKDNPGLDAVALLDHLQLTKAAAAEAKEQERAVLEAARGKQAAPSGAGLLSADNKPPEPKAIPAEPKRSSDLLSADNKPSEQSDTQKPGSAAVKRRNAPDDKKSMESSSPFPNQRHDLDASAADSTKQQEDGQPRRLPYDDPTYVAMHLELKMTPADFVMAARFMTAQCWDKAGQAPSLDLLKEMLTTAAQRDPGSLRALLEEFTTRAEAS
ncbi:ParB/RepB/Spo0J family partition protein [Streptomyces sp. NEAU-W12]|uniref:ParB/RepB/Spo0J family partition protein n=1 Tax=Streptomyces sp. NEAU-W12 TaxID=2994668 RepID=UPI00224AB9F2|nr:ParB/RepB/Spo0J family partition protein [Streptomyces sp. NEAU-W12]MCX2927905.1 ParB/RepB/Spo0J family partition protein [Streptomyces sp. NEAU-W12]